MGTFPPTKGCGACAKKPPRTSPPRMAFVPRTLEARGLDATPQIQLKLQKIGSDDALEASKILDIILHEEVGHVAIGNHWYRWLCLQQRVSPQAHYTALLERYQAPWPKPPLNRSARHAAGFTAQEIAWLRWAHPHNWPACFPAPSFVFYL